MNDYDSSLYEEYLTMNGLKYTDNISKADIIIINTCAVREKSTEKAISFLGKAKKIKDSNKDLIICFAGCMSPIYEQKLIKDRYIDLILGPLNNNSIPKNFEELINKIKNKDTLNQKNSNNISHFLTIIFGCNAYCSYCIVPFVRGREKSIPLEELITLVRKLSKGGTKEIILLGQNVNHYGLDLNNSVNFVKLLNEISRIEDIKRIGFMTSHPKDFDLQIINLMKEENKIYRHFHLPIQSGDDKILKLMNRGYTVNEYLKIISKIRNDLPLASITTDIIVGFPGESETAFLNTVNLTKELKFDTIYAASYSKRPKTLSSKFADEIDICEKKRRLNYLLSIQREISEIQMNRFINTEENVLISEKICQDKYLGKNSEEKNVRFQSDKNFALGDIVRLKVINRIKTELIGKYINDK